MDCIFVVDVHNQQSQTFTASGNRPDLKLSFKPQTQGGAGQCQPHRHRHLHLLLSLSFSWFTGNGKY